MKCPYCGHIEQRVLDSRPARDEEAIRRRRECCVCNRRFTTFEEPEKPRLYVVKRRGDREEFHREKVMTGMITACRKRPVSQELLRDTAERIEREMFDLCEPEVSSTTIGDRVMEALLGIDEVAYVRFASVYREFESPREFREIVDNVRRAQKRRVPAQT
ncbi:MAG: transcriptional repressor NrdR [Armatimonadetes bacterium]|nr:transcriptional repressor NrdR [Armatimonadota bacterium]